MALYNFISDDQIKRCIGQFMRALSGFQVQDGVDRDGDGEKLTKRVPIVYGEMDRIVASIINKREHFTTQVSVPMMAVTLRGIEIDKQNRRPNNHVDEFVMGEGSTPEGVVRRVFGPPLTLSLDLNMFCSSRSELFQLLEQILLVFNPRVTINIDDDKANADYITEIFLESIEPEITYPIGTDKSTVVLGLSFRVPIRLKYPSGVVDTIIKEIHSRIKDESDEIIIEEIIT